MKEPFAFLRVATPRLLAGGSIDGARSHPDATRLFAEQSILYGMRGWLAARFALKIVVSPKGRTIGGEVRLGGYHTATSNKDYEQRFNNSTIRHTGTIAPPHSQNTKSLHKPGHRNMLLQHTCTRRVALMRRKR